jgi:hypothetical protein
MALGWSDISGSDPLFLASYDKFLSALNRAQSGSAAPAGQGIVADAGSPVLDRLNVKYIIAPRTLPYKQYTLVLPGDVNVYLNPHALGEVWYDTATDGTPKVLSSTPGRIQIDAATPANTLLVTGAIYDPGWQVKVDDKPVRPIVADTIFTAVPLTAGAHTISLRYLPPAIQFGLYLTCVAWLILAGLAAYSASANPVNSPRSISG